MVILRSTTQPTLIHYWLYQFPGPTLLMLIFLYTKDMNVKRVYNRMSLRLKVYQR